tara:strand:- start:475 stop:1041 length:567 start_codon:yes stop_codon:yes gene_type:complete
MIEGFNAADEVIPALSEYTTIIVTGPQRSGTTVASVMFAKDLGYKVWDEHSHWNNFSHIIRYGANPPPPGVVIQAPALSWCIEKLPRMPNVIVVWMLRDGKDIDLSQKRIGWKQEREELSRYITKYGCSEDERIFEAKLRIWREVQSKKMRVAFRELEYSSDYITSNEIFIEKDKRSNFGSKQVVVAT